MSAPDFDAIVAKLVREYDPEEIILFGSYAWGTPRPESDVDLFIVKKTDQPWIKRNMEVRNILADRDFPLDVMVNTPSEVTARQTRSSILNKIIHEGKYLYRKRG